MCLLTPSDLSIFTEGRTSVSGNASVDSCGSASLFPLPSPPACLSLVGEEVTEAAVLVSKVAVAAVVEAARAGVTVAAQVATALHFSSMD